MGVDTRKYARAGLPVTDAACILCGSCVVHCPRGTLRLAMPDEREAEDSVQVQQAAGWRAA
jgi:Fe-S-cluster-containing hydrogenase component 2